MLLKLILALLLSSLASIGFCQDGYQPALDEYMPDALRPNQYPLDDDGFIIDSETGRPVTGTQQPQLYDPRVNEPNQGQYEQVIRPSYPQANPQDRVDGWNVESVLRQIDSESQYQNTAAGADSVWWTPHVVRPVNSGTQPIQVNVGDLILMALENSAKINVARALPRIRETAIIGAEAAFDWNKYIDARWVDTSEPVGSRLTVGGNGDRFREHNFAIDAGFRRKFFNGADFYAYQRMGHVNNNSSFFDPNNQATSRIVLGYTQPLMRGRGEVYNTSLILLAQVDTGSATDEFHRQLQAHLLEVARGYWALYLERTNLAQKVSLFLKTQQIANQLNSRSNIDAKQSQVISANAALESRKSELIRARAAVKNAETRLRALINSPMLSEADMIEMIPSEHPATVAYPAEHQVEFQTALQNRPELASALKAIRAGCIRHQMSDHEILPSLNLVTEAYVSGLRGDSDISKAWVDQFQEGEPSYSVGIQYEVPIGRRAAFSNLQRRQVEIRQLEEQYRATLELVRAEVEVAVRELHTSYQEMQAKHRSLIAAEAEVATLDARWNELGDQGGTGGLLLESLLRAQERVTQFEYEFAKSQMTYSLALINLRHANGTLYQTHGNLQPQGQFQSQGQPQVMQEFSPVAQPINQQPHYGNPNSGYQTMPAQPFGTQPQFRQDFAPPADVVPTPRVPPTPPIQPKPSPPKKIIQNSRQYQNGYGNSNRYPINQRSAKNSYQQANNHWQADPRYRQRPHQTGRLPQAGQAPPVARTASGLSYGEMIGQPNQSSGLGENDWRKLLR